MAARVLMAVLSLTLPGAIHAQFSGAGTGTQNDPYLIFNPVHLNQVRNYTNNPNVWFKLMDDLDMSEWIGRNNPLLGWSPIGTSSQPFKGHFLGEGHTVKGLYVNASAKDYQGFFGCLSDASIENLTVEINVSGNNYIGGMSGKATSTTATNLHVVAKSIEGSQYVGGLFGSFSGSLTGCSSTVAIRGYESVGGLVGELLPSTTVTNCTTKSDISVSSTAGTKIGGAFGSVNYTGISSTYTIFDIIATTTIKTLSGNTNVGGLIGYLYGATLRLNEEPSSSKYQIENNSSISLNNINADASITGSATSGVGGLIGMIARLEKKSNVYYNYSTVTDFTINRATAIADINVPSADNVGGLIGDAVQCSVTNAYYTGAILGNGNVGGLSGQGASFSKCYSSGNIYGVSNVAGLVGKAQNTTIKSCFSLCPVISASQSDAGRIYASGSPTCGSMGGTTTNYSLVDTKISINGKEKPYVYEPSEGDVSGIETMRLRATYQGLGWDFSSDWSIQETECLPYRALQTAPPVVLSAPAAGAFIVTGKSVDAGTVYMRYEDQVYSTEVIGNTWTIRTDPLKPGKTLDVWAESPGRFRSYTTTAIVSYPGSGTPDDPYQIYTATDLMNINGSGYYKIMNDIDLTGINWVPVGRTSAAMTVLDGGNNTVTGLTINEPATAYTGMFSSLNGATICNLTIAGASVTGGDYTGVLAGQMTNCTVSNVTVSEATVNGKAFTGGLTGYAGGSTSISLSAYSGSITGSTPVGGIAGELAPDASVNRCGTQGSVTATGTDGNAGGITGVNRGKISDAFTTSVITSTGYAAGIVALNYSEIRRCYASGNLQSDNLAGGIVAYNDGPDASLDLCAVAMENISITSQTGNGMRVTSGIRNGAPVPSKDSNLAFGNMKVSVNGVPQEIYDDPMNGKSTTGDNLRTRATYTALGWDFTEVWTINGTAMPELKGVMSVGGQSRNDNYFYVSNVETLAGKQIELVVNMKSKDKIAGFQFDLVLPEGFSIAYDDEKEEDCVYKGSRLTRYHAIAHRESPEGNMRFICTPSRVTELLGDDGDLARIVLNVAPTVVNGNYSIGLINIHLSDMSAQDIALPRVGILAKVLNDFVSVSPVEVMKGQETDLTVNVDNQSELTAIQFDLFMPDRLRLVNDANGRPLIKMTNRDNGKFIVETKQLSDGSLRVIAYSADGSSVLSGNTGAAMTIRVAAPADAIPAKVFAAFKNIYLANKALKSFECPALSAEIEITRLRRKGDVNTDGVITAPDMIGASKLMTGTNEDNLDFWAADIDDNNAITSIDTKTISNLAFSEVLVPSMARRADDAVKAPARADSNPIIEIEECGMADDSFSYFSPITAMPGETVDLTLNLINPDKRFAVESWNIDLPDGFTFELSHDMEGNPYQVVYEESSRCRGDIFFISNFINGHWRMGATNMNFSYNYKKSSGPVYTFKLVVGEDVKPGVYTITHRDYEATTEDDRHYTLPDEKTTIVIGNPDNIDHMELAGRFEEGTEPYDAVKTLVAENPSLLSLDARYLMDYPVTVKSANPNTIILTDSKRFTAAEGNVAVDGNAKLITLTDGQPYGLNEEIVADKVVYTRTLAPGVMESLYLPFAATELGGATLHRLNGLHTDNSLNTTKLTAHTPHTSCLIYSSDGGEVELSAENAILSPEASAVALSTFTGNYKRLTTDDTWYGLENGKFVETNNLLPFRAYFSKGDFNDVPTAIDAIAADNAMPHTIYTIQGIKLNCDVKALLPGVYVIDGRKVLVR